jgi:hypothetical protein
MKIRSLKELDNIKTILTKIIIETLLKISFVCSNDGTRLIDGKEVKYEVETER